MTFTNIVPITELWREWVFLNPNYEVPIDWEGLTFPTLRHALEATKTLNMEERRELIKQHPFFVTDWGSNRPHADDPYLPDWLREVEDLTLILTATKFGLVSAKSDKAKLGTRHRYQLAFWLTLTQGRTIVHENTHCDTFWGVCFCNEHRVIGRPTGDNRIGKAMMTIRERLIRGSSVRSFLSATCDWCYEKRNRHIAEATNYIIYFVDGRLIVHSFCPKHEQAEKHDARKNSDDGEWFIYTISDVPSEIEMNPIQVSLIDEGRTRGGWRRPRSSTKVAGFIPAPTYSSSNHTYNGRYTSGDYREWGCMMMFSDGTETNNVVSGA